MSRDFQSLRPAARALLERFVVAFADGVSLVHAGQARAAEG